MAEQGFFTIRQGDGGGRGGGGGRAPGGPPPPPPPPPGPRAQGGGGGMGPPRPNIIQVHPQPGHGMPPMGMHQMPPPPPREMVPMRLQQRPVEVVDIRPERMTDREMREELSDFFIYRFEKVEGDERYDLDGRRLKADWKKVARTAVRDISKREARMEIHRLDQRTGRVMDKKRALNPDQQRQLEKALDELNAIEQDKRNYHVELVQIDHQLKLKKDVKDRHDSYSHGYGHGHGFSFRIKKDSHHRNKSRDSKSKERKRTWERTSLTAYYKRCPRPDAQIGLMWREREALRNTPTPQQQLFLQQQHQQHMHQQQQQHQQHHGPPPPPHHGARPPIPPGGGHGAHGGHGGHGPPQGGKGPRILRMDSSSGSESESSDDEVFSEDDSRTTRTSGTSSYGRGRPRKKEKPYLEPLGPGHFGVPHRRHSKHEDNYVFDVPRAVPPAPVPPRTPLLPPPEIELIKANAYAAGKADGKMEERVDARFVEDAARVRLPASRPRTLPPRIIQQPRRGSVRLVTASEGDYELELDRFERLHVDDREPIYEDRRWDDRYRDELDEPGWRDDVRRRRHTERPLRYEDDVIIVEPSHGRDRVYDRERLAHDYMRRRESSPVVSFSNPFAPQPPRRASVSYRDQYYP